MNPPPKKKKDEEIYFKRDWKHWLHPVYLGRVSAAGNEEGCLWQADGQRNV